MKVNPEPLRAAINMSNARLVTGRNDDGSPSGLAPSLAALIAEELGRDIVYVEYALPAEAAAAVLDEAWDICLIAADPDRSEHIAFTRPYFGLDCTYAVREEGPLTSPADVDQPGIRIATVSGAAYTLWLERNIEQAKLIKHESIPACDAAFARGEADALAGLRARHVANARPGIRVLDENFTTAHQAVGIPRTDATGLLESVDSIIEAALDSGTIPASST